MQQCLPTSPSRNRIVPIGSGPWGWAGEASHGRRRLPRNLGCSERPDAVNGAGVLLTALVGKGGALLAPPGVGSRRTAPKEGAGRRCLALSRADLRNACHRHGVFCAPRTSFTARPLSRHSTPPASAGADWDGHISGRDRAGSSEGSASAVPFRTLPAIPAGSLQLRSLAAWWTPPFASVRARREIAQPSRLRRARRCGCGPDYSPSFRDGEHGGALAPLRWAEMRALVGPAVPPRVPRAVRERRKPLEERLP